MQAACKAACRSKLPELRVRDDNPAASVEAPDRGVAKAKQFLYPSEVDAFARCGELPLAYGRLVVVQAYTYLRPGELAVLRWRDVDLDRGVVRIHRARDHRTGDAKSTKTGHNRDLRLEPSALALLRTMHDEHGGELVVPDGLVDLDHLTKPFREALLVAGIDRPALHEAEATSKPMTWYDLRATGITWRAVRGDDPLRIRYDAGHRDFTTTQGYIRAADAFRGDAQSFGEVFASPRSLLNLGNARVIRTIGGFRKDISAKGGT